MGRVVVGATPSVVPLVKAPEKRRAFPRVFGRKAVPDDPGIEREPFLDDGGCSFSAQLAEVYRENAELRMDNARLRHRVARLETVNEQLSESIACFRKLNGARR